MGLGKRQNVLALSGLLTSGRQGPVRSGCGLILQERESTLTNLRRGLGRDNGKFGVRHWRQSLRESVPFWPVIKGVM
jgi:hypothetical protein